MRVPVLASDKRTGPSLPVPFATQPPPTRERVAGVDDRRVGAAPTPKEMASAHGSGCCHMGASGSPNARAPCLADGHRRSGEAE